MKTVLHAYNFNTTDAQQAEEYKRLCDKLKAEGLTCFCTWGSGKGHYYGVNNLDGQTIDLDAKWLYDNQWNTAGPEGLRVFDWAEDYPINFSVSIKRGHWLEQTQEMKDARHNTAKCGYCRKQEPVGAFDFCPHCLDSPYLKEPDLHLLRMLPIDHKGDRQPLTAAENAELMLEYVKRQTTGADSRNAEKLRKQRADILAEFNGATANATANRDGLLWLMDHGVSIDNVIYYHHTGRFGFGWRAPVSQSVKSALLDVLCEFPFDYDITAEAVAA